MLPAASQTVTPAAPAAIAVCSASARKAGSARVASSARNSTSSQTARAAATVWRIASSMAAGFLPARYSICTALTGAGTWMRGCFASLSAAQTSETLAGSSATGTHTALSFTAEATDLMSRLSIFGFSTACSSMTLTPSRSRSLASSIFSRNESV